MIVLMRIIGWEDPSDKLESPENVLPLPGTDQARPPSCPSCLAPAWEDGKLMLVGHGSYRRWIKAPGEGKIGIRRFLCEREDCGKTCSVLPHWLLPRFQYTAPLVLTSLSRYHVDGETARSVTAQFGLNAPKLGWGTLHRWSSAFLVSTILWGWLGPRLGVRKGTSRSRDQVRVHLERFMRSFTDRVKPNTTSAIPEIVRLSLNGRVFDGGKAWSSLHPPCGRIRASTPHRTRPGPPTHRAGRPRGPP